MSNVFDDVKYCDRCDTYYCAECDCSVERYPSRQVQASRPPIKWPTEEEVQKEVWSRIHRHESAKEFPLPQKIMREITAEAYWSACYSWLKSFVEKGNGE